MTAEELAADRSLMADIPRVLEGAPRRRAPVLERLRFEILDQLADAALIADGRRATSVVLTDLGVRRARALLARYGWATVDPWQEAG